MDLVSLNIEYLLLRGYTLFGSIDPSQVPHEAFGFIERLSWAFIAVSVVTLGTLIYTRLQLAAVTHAIWDRRFEEEAAATAPVEEKNPRWAQVIQLVNSEQGSDWRRAIIEADVMLFELLAARGFSGASVGEQLKGASAAHFATRDLAWDAHRVRNEIAHGGESYPLTERDAHATVDLYRRVFEEFGYI